MSEALTAVLKKIVTYIVTDVLTDAKKRNAVLLVIGSIIVGLIGLMAAPIAVLYGMSEMDIPDISVPFDESSFRASLDPDKQEKIREIETDGNEIASALTELDLNEQIIKAQLIYFSFFEDDRIADFSAYAELFEIGDDSILLEKINEKYDKAIGYDDFMTTYTMIMNRTVNEYMFTNPTVKNSTDLAAWARNAYVSGWGYKDGSYGEIDKELHYRCADNLGLIVGYMRYSPDSRVFDLSADTLTYDVIGSIETMPDVQGIGVCSGTEFGIYTGDGEVVSSSAIGGCVQKSELSEWSEWCTFAGIEYPDEVIDAIQNTTEETTKER